jgi:homoisocitrate dehydrogenase
MTDLCVIEGDGIGQEVIPAAVRVLQSLMPDLKIVYASAGWECFLKQGVSVPQETLEKVRNCGAALFGAVSSPAYKVEGYKSAILTLRQELGLYANIRPVRSLPIISPRQAIDFIVVRENTEGLYAGRERFDGETAIAERVISRQASQRIGRKALEITQARLRKKITIVHKANILPLTDGLFRDTIRALAPEYFKDDAAFEIEELLVDTAALKLVEKPEDFDVLVTTNLFGDILSDLGAYWCGGIGLAPSINLGAQLAIAEPVHGSAPDIAGKGIANPIAAILSAALLARYFWGLEPIAQQIEAAVNLAIAHDLKMEGSKNMPKETTESITQAVLNRVNASKSESHLVGYAK